MMKNIRGHRFLAAFALLFAFPVQAQRFAEIKMQFLEPTSECFAQIAALWQEHRGIPMNITFDKAALPFIQFLAQRSTATAGGSHPLMWLGILCGGATVSYWTIACGIWKAYGIARTACSLYRWALPFEDEGIAQSLNDLEKVLFRNGPAQIGKDDQQFLKTYKRINNILRRLHIRSLFPYDHALETFIDQFHFAKK